MRDGVREAIGPTPRAKADRVMAPAQNGRADEALRDRLGALLATLPGP